MSNTSGRIRLTVTALAVAAIFGIGFTVAGCGVSREDRLAELQRQMPKGCKVQALERQNRSPYYLVVCDGRQTTSLFWQESSGKTSWVESLYWVGPAS